MRSPQPRRARIRALVAAALFGACAPSTSPPAVEPVLDIPRLDGGSAAPTAPAGVRFGRVPPAVGARWKVTVSARSASADPQGGLQRSEYVSSYIVEVLGTNGPAPSRVRLVFEKNVQRLQGRENPTAIDGKTYVVDATPASDGAGGFAVRDGSGAPVTEEEQQRVLDVVPDLGTRTQVDQILPDSAMTIGDARDELAGAILRVIHPRAWTLNKGTAVLARTQAEDAVFALTIDATGSNGIRMVVSGEAKIRLRDARLVEIALDGTYDRAMGPGPDPGTFSLRRTTHDL